MCHICDMYNNCDKCAYSSRVAGVTHIAHIARAILRTHIPDVICVTVDAVALRNPLAMKETEKGGSRLGTALVRSCEAAGVATGDGRHQPIRAGQRAPDLDAGSASRCASVHTDTAGSGTGGIWNVERRMLRQSSSRSNPLARPGRFDEPPPGADGNRFEPPPGAVGPSLAFGRSKFTSGITKTPVFVLPEGRVRGSRSPNPKLAFRPWPLASSQPDRAEGPTGIRRGPGYAARRIPPTALETNNHHQYGNR